MNIKDFFKPIPGVENEKNEVLKQSQSNRLITKFNFLMEAVVFLLNSSKI